MSFIRVNGIAYNTDGVYSILIDQEKAHVTLKDFMVGVRQERRITVRTSDRDEIDDLRAFVERETGHSKMTFDEWKGINHD